MRKYLKFTLFLIAVSFIIFSGCKKHDVGLPIIIVQTATAFDQETSTQTGTFTTSGGIQTSGTYVMDIIFVADSFYCNNKLIAPEGTIITDMKCSAITMTGSWKILRGDRRYKRLNGGGTLVMTTPGGVDVETLTGKVFFH